MTSAPRWVTERPIAHRGLHDDLRPENSMGAFEASVDAGLAFELDVHPSRDGAAVVFHDVSLERMTGERGDVRAWPWHRLKSLRLGSTDQRIPELADVLDLVAGRVPIVVEIKNEDDVGIVERAVASALDNYEGPVAVQSFNPLTVAWFRRARPAIPRGLLAGDLDDTGLGAAKRFALRHLLLAPYVRPAYVGYDLRALPQPSVSLVRRLGVPTLAWTVRTSAQRERARELADNYIFEFVDPVPVASSPISPGAGTTHR